MISDRPRQKRSARLRRPAFLLVLFLVSTPFVFLAWGQERIPFPRPDTHRGNWIENHGFQVAMSMSDPGQAGRLCLSCHEKNDCISCHAMTPPRDHNNYWRLRGHGLAAGVSRERCSACHRQDFCVRCHNETAPSSHTASWRARHCGWCHYASVNVPADPCSVCHRLAPHTSAPAGHPVFGPLTDCSACH
jgi:hypothetical protein